jgi:hypothetical protein
MSRPISPELYAIKNRQQITREECILPGTTVCGGCGGLSLHALQRLLALYHHGQRCRWGPGRA